MKGSDDIKDNLLARIEEVKLYKSKGEDRVVRDQVSKLYNEIISSNLPEKEKSHLLLKLKNGIGAVKQYIIDDSLSENDSSEIRETVKNKVQEIKLYRDQGMDDVVSELIRELIEHIQSYDRISSQAKKELLLLMEDELGDLSGYLTDRQVYKEDSSIRISAEHVEISESDIQDSFGGDPEEQFKYARDLMSIHNWDEAITILKVIAATGYRYEECYELCGDCAYRAGRYDEAIEYYEIVYTIPDIHEETRKRIFDKITRCRQKKFMNKLSLKKGEPRVSYDEESSLFLVSHVEDLYQYSGSVLKSWSWDRELPWKPDSHIYHLGELLQLGSTWAVFEASRESDGKSFAAITLTPHWWKCVDRDTFIEWVYMSMMMDSEYLSVPEDLAVASNGTLFVIRPYYEHSLVEYMSERREKMNLDEIMVVGYQILEGLGYLHLHFARDRQKRKIYHLDLRPSRIFLFSNCRVKVAYGGLWHIFMKYCPHLTNYRNLPLAFLAYRAPEQFRSYLWSPKKPLVCTDVYQFGVIFYEMLTGINPFSGESVEEIEMLHCDQKPIPPQVIRPDLPEEVSEIVMNCLNTFPSKRWRSTTQILLAIEKILGGTSRIREIIFRKKGEVHDRLGEI